MRQSISKHRFRYLFIICICISTSLYLTHIKNKDQISERSQNREQTSEIPHNQSEKVNQTFSNVIKYPNHIYNPRKIIFLIGQGRVGSSLIGNFFQENADFIYFLEPFLGIEHYHDNWYNDFQMHPYDHEKVEFFEDIIKCNYRQSLDPFFNLLVRKVVFPHSNGTTNLLILNSTLMNEICRRKNVHIVVKELSGRLQQNTMKILNNLSLKLKVPIHVIHLVRDPRANLLGMKDLLWFNATNEDMYMKQRCDDIYSNVKYGTTELRTDGFMKYTTLRYEDISKYSKKIAKKLSRFLDIELENVIQSYLVKMTKYSKNNFKGGEFSLHPRDMSVKMNKWQIPYYYTFVMKVQKYCNHSMNILGYQMASKKDMEKPSVITKFVN